MAYAVEPTRLYSAPGRLNLMGNHVETSEGLVLNCAIDRETVVALGSAAEGDAASVDAVAIDMGRARDRFSLNHAIDPGENHWQNLVRGVAQTFRRFGHRLRPVRLAIAGDIPIGVGLASSTSLCVAVAVALSYHSGLALTLAQLAELAFEAEREHSDRESLWSDAVVAACSEAGSALLIDCQNRQHMPIPLKDELTVAAIECGVSRAWSSDDTKARETERIRASQHYQAKALRDLTLQIVQDWREKLDASAYARARYVVGEIERVEPMAVALVKGDTSALAQLMRASHVSLRDDYLASDPCIDRLVDVVGAALGERGGARLAVAGRGRNVVVVLGNDAVGSLIEAVEERFNRPGEVPAQVEVYSAAKGAERAL